MRGQRSQAGAERALIHAAEFSYPKMDCELYLPCFVMHCAQIRAKCWHGQDDVAALCARERAASISYDITAGLSPNTI